VERRAFVYVLVVFMFMIVPSKLVVPFLSFGVVCALTCSCLDQQQDDGSIVIYKII